MARRGTGHILLGWVLSLLLLTIALACTTKTENSEIWYLANIREIRTINPVTLQQRVIIPRKGHMILENPSLSPNGGKIAYVGRGDGDGSAVWVADSDGSNDRRISQSFASVSFLWLDERSLVIMGTDVTYRRPDEGQIALYDLSTEKTRPLVIPDIVSLCEDPKRPDRVTSWSERYPALGRLAVRDGALIEIPDVTINVPESAKWRFGRACLSWSSDAQKILILGYVESDNLDLFVTTDGGRTIDRLTGFAKSYGGTSVQPFDISPDGKWVIFDAQLYQPVDPSMMSGEYVALVSPSGGEPQLLMQTQMLGYFAWSPDSKRVAAGLVPRGGGADHAVLLHVINAETREVKQLTFDEGQQEAFDWRLDSRKH